LLRECAVFSRIKKEGDFVLSSGVKSDYTYEYGDLSDAMNESQKTSGLAKATRKIRCGGRL